LQSFSSTFPPTSSPGFIVPVSSGITPSKEAYILKKYLILDSEYFVTFLAISQYNSCQQGLSICCLPSYQCGIRYPPVANAPSPAPGTNQAAFGAYPWQGR